MSLRFSFGSKCLLLVSVCILLSLAGCSWLGPAVDPAAAKETVQQFMEYRLRGDLTLATALLSEAAADRYEKNQQLRLALDSTNPQVTDWSIREEQVNRNIAQYTIRIQERFRPGTLTWYWDETLSVRRGDEGHFIDGARFGGRTLVRSNPSLELEYARLDAQGKPTGKPTGVLRKADIPDEMTPSRAAEDISFGVGKEGYTLLSFSPSGDRLAVGTWGTHGYLGIVELGEQERQLRSLDLFFEGAALEATWSDDGRLLAVTVTQPTGTETIRVYDADSGQLKELGLYREFPPETYTLEEAEWVDGHDLRFLVRLPQGGQSSKIGVWILDTDTEELVRGNEEVQ